MIFERKRTVCRLSGPPSGPAPGPSDSIPPPAPGGYGPSFYPPGYYPPPQPPKKSNAALIIVIVVVVAVLVSVVLAAVLYLLTSALLEPPNPPPMVVFGAVLETAGNATIPIASSFRELSPSSLHVPVSSNTSGSSRGMPPPNGSVVLIAGGRTLPGI